MPQSKASKGDNNSAHTETRQPHVIKPQRDSRRIRDRAAQLVRKRLTCSRYNRTSIPGTKLLKVRRTLIMDNTQRNNKETQPDRTTIADKLKKKNENLNKRRAHKNNRNSIPHIQLLKFGRPLIINNTQRNGKRTQPNRKSIADK